MANRVTWIRQWESVTIIMYYSLPQLTQQKADPNAKLKPICHFLSNMQIVCRINWCKGSKIVSTISHNWPEGICELKARLYQGLFCVVCYIESIICIYALYQYPILTTKCILFSNPLTFVRDSLVANSQRIIAGKTSKYLRCIFLCFCIVSHQSFDSEMGRVQTCPQVFTFYRWPQGFYCTPYEYIRGKSI